MLSLLYSYMTEGGSLQDLLLIASVLVFVCVCCLPVHECAHAWMAERLGDSTGRLKGRISFNPMAHLSLVGTLLVLLFGFGYAKPVPVNIRNFKHRKLYFALTSLAGPVSNIVLAVIFLVIANLSVVVRFNSPFFANLIYVTNGFFSTAAYFNIVLAVFNMLPIPPLDGSRILTMILPDKYYYKILSIERYFTYILFAAIFIFNRIGFSPISLIAEYIYDTLVWLTSLPFIFFV